MENIEPNKVYVLNKEEVLIAVFDRDDENTIMNPRVKETQNAEAIFTFYISPSNPKWEQIKNPENLYVVDNKVFSTNFEGCFTETINENNEDSILVTAYERQKLLSRKYVKTWNSETGFEAIDNFMVVVLSNGDLPLKNGENVVTSRFLPGTSGYVLDALLYGTGWTTGTCDVEGTFDLETDQVDVYENILKVQEMWGGILVFDSINKVVHHRDETKFLPYDGYEVKYQKNMQSLEKLHNNKIITKLCPLGEGGLNIKSVNNGSEWLTNNTYTSSVLEGLENNPDIYDPEQLKRWGERKLQDLCKPRKELTVNAVLLKQVEGYELEDIHLNDIVEVINYAYSENEREQLRVVRYEHGIWDYSDAVLELSDVTLDSTDIFKKNVQATNSINDGTLNAAKVISFFKNGKSVDSALKTIDRTIVTNYSELTKADDEITARVVQTETDVDDLTNTVIAERQKIAEVQLTVDELNAKIQDIADITTQGETEFASLILTGVNESEPIMINIHPTTTNISYLYPHEGLYPSETLYMTDRKIRFTNVSEYQLTQDLYYNNYRKYYSYDETENEYTLLVAGIDYTIGNPISGNIYENKYVDYTLPDDLLTDGTVYDEFILSYDSQVCQIIKRCEYNADGTVSALDEEEVYFYDYPLIELSDGDYTIELLGYSNGYMNIRLMGKNVYTTQFYTKIETNARIQAKADEINIGVNQKLTNYSTTTEMNTAIDVKADEITSTVSNTYETKGEAQQSYTQLQQTANNISATVENNNTKANIIAKINDNTSQAQIHADVIDLNANDVLNILSGNQINMTTKNLTIASNNFSVDANGNIVANGGYIGGFALSGDKIQSNNNAVGMTSANWSGAPSFWAGADPWTIGDWTNSVPFYVTNQGYLKSTSGKIGGYTIDSYKLTGSNVGMCSEAGYEWAFWAGASEGGNAPFHVGHAGELYATNANITGNINATSGTFQNCTISDNCSVASASISGTLSANKINGGTISASTISLKNVTLGTGSSKIGGFTINSNNLKASTSNGNIGMGLNLYGNTPAFYVESSNGDNWAVMTSNGFFTNGSINNGASGSFWVMTGWTTAGNGSITFKGRNVTITGGVITSIGNETTATADIV